MQKLKGIEAKARLLAVSCMLATAGSAQALTTFTDGTPASASAVNGNFTELKERLDVIQGVTQIFASVDCVADGMALQTLFGAGVAPGTNITISGTCAGPITIDSDYVALHGATLSDGIAVTTGATEVLTVRAKDVELSSLQLDAGGNPDMTALVIIHGDAQVSAVNVVNNLNGAGLWVGRGGEGGFSNIGSGNWIGAGDGGYARLHGGNTDVELLVARGGIAESRGTNSFTRLGVYDNGTFRMKSGASLTINGDVEVMNSSTVKFQSPVTINGNVTLKTSSTSHIAGGSTISGTQFTIENADVYLGPGSSITMTSVGNGLYVKDNAVLRSDGYDDVARTISNPSTINADVRAYRGAMLNADNMILRTPDGLAAANVRVRNASLNLWGSSAGPIDIAGNAFLQLDGDAQVFGDIRARRGVNVEMWEGVDLNSPQINGIVQLYQNSSLTMDGNSHVIGSVSVSGTSSVQLYSNAAVSSTGTGCDTLLINVSTDSSSYFEPTGPCIP